MKKPNLFIIGAPKCGTTSLAYWLGNHPNVYMSPLKEPFYFDKDHIHSPMGQNIYRYEDLFKDAKKKHRVIGEASTKYLISKVAVDNILDYNPDSHFIVCLRNPIKMSYSLHQQEFFSGTENVKNFRRAWSLQEKRAKGMDIPPGCNDSIFLQYKKVCALGSQCDELLKKITSEKVFFVVLDDLKVDPLSVYKSLLNFLNLKYDGRTDFNPRNTSKELRSRFLQKIIRRLGEWKRKLGIYKSTGIYRLNTKRIQRPSLAKEMIIELEKTFEDEIIKLEKTLNRDFSYWFKYLR